MNQSGQFRPAGRFGAAEDYPWALSADDPPLALPVDEIPVLELADGKALDVPVAELVQEPPKSRAGVVGQILAALGSAWEWAFGTLSLMFGLAVLAAIPLLQFLSLGYLLEVGGRVGRSGRLRDGFIGARPAARIGSI